MLKNKDFDVCLLGRNYFSYLFSLLLARKGRRVLLVDDPRVALGAGWCDSIGMLERLTLKKMGELLGIAPFKEIDRYLAPHPMQLVLGPPNGAKRFHIGQLPSSNLREFLCKFPQAFMGEGEMIPWNQELMQVLEGGGAEDFNNQFVEYCRLLAEHHFRPNQRRKRRIGAKGELSSLAPPPLLLSMSKNLHHAASSSPTMTKNLIYLAQSYFQGKVSDEVDLEEALHIMLSLVSPRYRLHTELLQKDLEQHFGPLGIVLKISELESFQLQQGKLGLLQLKSFEGLVRPGKVYFMGSLQPSLPLRLLGPTPMKGGRVLYHACHYNLKATSDCFTGIGHETMLFSPLARMGTRIPMWELRFNSNRECRATFIYSLGAGDRPDFYHELFLELLTGALAEIFPDLGPLASSFQMARGLGDEIWVEGKFLEEGKGAKGPEVWLVAGPEGREAPVKNVTYLGPGMGRPFGPLSLLREIFNRAEM